MIVPLARVIGEAGLSSICKSQSRMTRSAKPLVSDGDSSTVARPPAALVTVMPETVVLLIVVALCLAVNVNRLPVRLHGSPLGNVAVTASVRSSPRVMVSVKIVMLK